ncbi:HDL401Wp [Eremothecium sinecaudum]|uniref:HDL401Wp n=1 Tax=Eremothecium sinecaudum TaxID=45286 RepID=A0A109UZI2_9SACH|nr:HDL401Wp [Eremothecium sinecaudum]AMD20343.1 HDL401Wp [Eremothecium sinecaudum]
MQIERLISLEPIHYQVLLSLRKFLCSVNHQVSQVCPVSRFNQALDLLVDQIQLVLFQHRQLEKYIGNRVIDKDKLNVYMQRKLLGLEKCGMILNSCLDLLFGRTLGYHPLSLNLMMMEFVLKIYSNLRQLAEVINCQRIDNMLYRFECQLVKTWNYVSGTRLLFDNVRDLHSPNFDFISPPLLKINQIAKRGFFRLSIPVLNYEHLLVDVCQLHSGELVVFKILEQQLPYSVGNSSKLLSDLIEGIVNVSSIGRSLLFYPVRKADFNIVREIENGFELQLCKRSNLRLQLVSLNSHEWSKFWRNNLILLFDNTWTAVPMQSTLACTKNTSHVLQKFRLKHEKLHRLCPPGCIGLGLELPFSPRPQIASGGISEITVPFYELQLANLSQTLLASSTSSLEECSINTSALSINLAYNNYATMSDSEPEGC